MDQKDKKEHWDRVYQKQQPDEHSWHESTPQSSLQWISGLNLPKDAPILDAGGGDSLLVDHLLHAGYSNITVLDISGVALQNAKHRLGANADRVHWVEADITAYRPDQAFACWHDRAVFHFLSTPEDLAAYRRVLASGLSANGRALIGTFSMTGPEKCSGLTIQRYSSESLARALQPVLIQEDCQEYVHTTPQGVRQDFIFCRFRRRGIS